MPSSCIASGDAACQDALVGAAVEMFEVFLLYVWVGQGVTWVYMFICCFRIGVCIIWDRG
jgi:hypothetical protein